MFFQDFLPCRERFGMRSANKPIGTQPEMTVAHTRHQIGVKHRLGFGVSDENKVVTGALPFGEGAPGKVCPG